jgi:glycine cleavage system transcriptional repressor
MQKTVVITGAGRDRVGIVAELADFLFKLGCNLLDSSMTLLRGEFALILMTTLPDGMSVDDLRAGLAKLQDKLVLNFSVRELGVEELAETDPARFQYIISVYGADKPGIVAGVTRKLAELKMNITDVQTKSVRQEKGEIFVMMIEVSAQDELAAAALQQQLKSFTAELGVDVSVRELEIMEL